MFTVFSDELMVGIIHSVIIAIAFYNILTECEEFIKD